MPEPMTLPPLGPGTPTAPIALSGEPGSVGGHLATEPVVITAEMLDALRSACADVRTDAAERAEASRDWWPLAMTWALDNQVGAVAGVVVAPHTVAEVQAVMAVCHAHRLPVTAAAGRSGVCGACIPVFGGVVLDLCALTGIRSVDETSLVLDVLPGTFGDHLEHELRTTYGLTTGHWPQSVTLSTVGGWVACRGAGQLSNKYGKIEDMVVGLDVVLADGKLITTGGNARQAAGPDLTELFIGSEGTLGVIVGVRMRLHPQPATEGHAAFGFDSFADASDACRRMLRRGLAPAVLRVYDHGESKGNFGIDDHAVLLVLDEGDPVVVDAAMTIAAEECRGAAELPVELVSRWLGHRNDVAVLEKVISGGLVVDTMEITVPWHQVAATYDAAVGAISAIDGVLAATAHLSHSYTDGACLYFTFAGQPDDKDAFYRRVWDAGTRTVLAHGGSLSHHHGVGLNRGRFMREALGPAFDTLVAVKNALDPHGICNPGKLGLDSPFGPAPFVAEAPSGTSGMPA